MNLPQLTCVSCQVAFAQSEHHRAHYKSDWHCYNLKRKLASLPPVTFENFKLRIAEQSAQFQTSQTKKSQYCTRCHKHFNSTNAFENHLKSRRHLETETEEEIKLQEHVKKRNEKNEEKGIQVLPENDKLMKKDAKNLAEKKKLLEISKQDSNDSDSSWEDMEDDDDADVDEEELYDITQCLFCSHGSGTVEHNVHHMTLVHSFFIPDVQFINDFEGLLSYLGEKISIDHLCLWCSTGNKGRAFHSLKSVQQHMIDKGHCKMLHDAQNIYEYADFYDYQSSYPDDAEEDPNAEVTPLNLSDESWELVLPSGARLGHRSLFRYFKQSLPLEKAKNSALPRRISSHYKALGWTGVTGAAAIQRAQDIKYMQKMKNKYYLKLGVKANKFQPHFRQQVLF